MIDYRILSGLARDIGPETPSTSTFWTDPHISARLLEAHLDTSTDAASRRPAAIEATIAWLEATVIRGPSRVLDLGCGPGLYARELARRGHRVTGMDFSERSVAYARESARAAGLDIEYAVADYVADELGSGYDLAMMIYCDLGALSPADRASVLRKVLRSLAPGGSFVFDFADDSVPGTSGEGRSWLLEESGFWSPRPHLVLEETKTYPELKMVQRMALVAEEDGSRIERYMIRDWCFSRDEMRDLVLGAGFSSCAFHRGFLPKPVWGTADPIFAVASAPRASEVRRVHHPCHDSVDDEPQDRDGADADRGNEDIEAHDRRDDHE